MNQNATRQFEPILSLMNSGRFNLGISGRQAGGNTTPGGTESGLVTVLDVDRLIDGFDKSMQKNRPVINANLDSLRFYFDTFENYKKESERRKF